MTKLTPDEAIDLAYDIFLEMAGENLDPADILLFNLQFEEKLRIFCRFFLYSVRKHNKDVSK